MAHKTNKSDYHSALFDENPNAISQYHYEEDGNIAFVHDVFNPLPDDFNRCDIFYSEISWTQGYDVFNQRAGKIRSPEYPQYLSAISKIIENNPQPCVLMIGKSMLKGLPSPDDVLNARIQAHTSPSIMVGYHIKFEQPFKMSVEFLKYAAKKYNCIGDFCCGYGIAGKIFKEAGKNYVMSDYNPKCIGYIAQHSKDWREDGNN